MKIYHVETQEAYDELMIELEEKGCTWISGEKLTDFDEFNTYGIDTYVYDECCKISASSGNYFKAHHSDELVIEYKAKGEEMKQEEMKQNILDLATDVSISAESFSRNIKFKMKKSTAEADLQEAKLSAKKLIEKIDEYLEDLKPKFKVGDYVTVYINDRTIIAKIDKLWEHTEEAHGLWYDQTKVNVKQDFWFISKVCKCRYATSEEIAEYEVALTFHKLGRKPFEVKDGDLLDNVFGKYIAHEHSFSKEDFTVGGNTLLKTADEVNEWLENK